MEEAGIRLVAQDEAGFNRALDQAGRSVQQFAKEADTHARGFSSGFSRVVTGALLEVGASLTRFAADGARALGGFVKDSIGVAGDFQAGMNKFAAVTGKSLEAAGTSVAEFEDLFIDLGKSTAFSAGEAQEAAINLAKGGLDPLTISGDGLKATLDLASAGALDLGTAADIVAKQLGVWGETGVTATEVGNALAQAANASTVDVDELALGLANVGGAAKASGVEFQDVVQTMGLIAPGFSSAADAGTSLKTFLLNLVPTTKPATEAMIGLGLATEDGSSKFFDAQGAFIGMEGASQLLAEKLTGLSDAQRVTALETIFGSDAIRTADALARAGAEGFQAFGAEMAATGTAASQAAAQNQGFNFALDEMKGSVETLQIVLGGALLPVLTDLVQGTITPGINKVLEFGESFLAAKDKGTFLAEAATGWGESLAAFAVDAAPKVRAAVDQLISNLVSWIKESGPGIVEGTATWIAGFVEWAIPAREQMLREVGQILEGLLQWIVANGPAIASQLGDWAIAFIKWVIPAAGDLLISTADLLADLLGWIVANSPAIASTLLTWALAFTGWVLTEAYPALIESLAEVALEMLSWIGEQGSEIVAAIVAWDKAMTEWVLKDALPALLSALGKLGSEMLGWIGEQAGKAAGEAKRIGSQIVEGIKAGLSAALSSLVAKAREIVNAAIDAAKAAAGISSPSTVFAEIGQDMIGGLVQGLEANADATQAAADLGHGVENAMRDALDTHSESKVFYQIGTDTIQGLINGMESMVPLLGRVASHIGGELTAQFEKLAVDIEALGAEIAENVLGGKASTSRQVANNRKTVEGLRKSVADEQAAIAAERERLSKPLEAELINGEMIINQGKRDTELAALSVRERGAGAQKAILAETEAAIKAAKAQADEVAKVDQGAAASLFSFRSGQIDELANAQLAAATGGDYEQGLLADVMQAQKDELAAFNAKLYSTIGNTAQVVDQLEGSLSDFAKAVSDRLAYEEQIANKGYTTNAETGKRKNYTQPRRDDAKRNAQSLREILGAADPFTAYVQGIQAGSITSDDIGLGNLLGTNATPESTFGGVDSNAGQNTAPTGPVLRFVRQSFRTNGWEGPTGDELPVGYTFPPGKRAYPPTPDQVRALGYDPAWYGINARTFIQRQGYTWAELPAYARGVASAPPGLSLVHAGELLINMRGGETVVPAARAPGILGGGSSSYTDSRQYNFQPQYGGSAPAQQLDYQLMRLLSL